MRNQNKKVQALVEYVCEELMITVGMINTNHSVAAANARGIIANILYDQFNLTLSEIAEVTGWTYSMVRGARERTININTKETYSEFYRSYAPSNRSLKPPVNGARRG